MCIHWVCSSCFSMITHIYNNILLNLNYLWDYNTLEMLSTQEKPRSTTNWNNNKE